MILADKIMEERKKNGWSQEELADKLSVSRQAVSKWESAQSVPDLQRVIKLAEIFSVSTDYLLKDEVEAQPPLEVGDIREDGKTLRMVSMEEANKFLDMKRKGAPMTAGGVAMCILSPVVLIFLAGLADSGIGNISEGFATGVGMVFLLVLIAIAVFIFISNGTREDKFDYLEKEPFETAYGVSGFVKEKQRDYEGTYTRGLAVGVVLCIVAVLPLIVASCIDVPDYISCALVSLLLILVATGVYLIVNVDTIKESYDMLLQEGEFSTAEKKIKKKMNLFNSAYWCLATAIYLGWSFWTNRWDFTWIVWAVAGVLYAAVAAIIKLVLGNKE